MVFRSISHQSGAHKDFTLDRSLGSNPLASALIEPLALSFVHVPKTIFARPARLKKVCGSSDRIG
jgi:hypothetical protein